MKRKEAILEIEKLSGKTFVNSEYYKLTEVLRKLENVKIVYRDRILYNDANLTEYIDYDREAARIANLYKISIDELKCKNRLRKYVDCRVYFCRYMKKKYGNITSVSLARYLNRDHSTVLYYLHRYKGECSIDTIPIKEYAND
jgi:chromosomal replication initiation ATPase DnaA